MLININMNAIFVSGSIFSILLMLILLVYLLKNCCPRNSIPKNQTTCELDNRYDHDLIDMDGLIVPVGPAPPRASRCASTLPAPPSYNDSINLPAESAAPDFTPQYSYSNR